MKGGFLTNSCNSFKRRSKCLNFWEPACTWTYQYKDTLTAISKIKSINNLIFIEKCFFFLYTFRVEASKGLPTVYIHHVLVHVTESKHCRTDVREINLSQLHNACPAEQSMSLGVSMQFHIHAPFPLSTSGCRWKMWVLSFLL